MGSQAVAANAPDGEGTPAHREHPEGLRETAQRQLQASPKFQLQRWGERQAVAAEVWAFLESFGAREAGGGAWRPQSKGPVDLMRTGECPKRGLEFRCQRHGREPPKVAQVRVKVAKRGELKTLLDQADAHNASWSVDGGVAQVVCTVPSLVARQFQTSVPSTIAGATVEWRSQWKEERARQQPPGQALPKRARGLGKEPSNRCGCNAKITVRWKSVKASLSEPGKVHWQFVIKGNLKHSPRCAHL